VSKYGSNQIVVKIDASDGGSLTDITEYITRIGDLECDKGTVTSTPFGTDAAEYLQGVVKNYPSFILGGFYDDTASTGPDAILNIGKVTHSQTRTFEITTGGTNKISGECWLHNYKLTFAVNEYHNFEVAVQPTGVITQS
jgi:hypothetical protein